MKIRLPLGAPDRNVDTHTLARIINQNHGNLRWLEHSTISNIAHMRAVCAIPGTTSTDRSCFCPVASLCRLSWGPIPPQIASQMPETLNQYMLRVLLGMAWVGQHLGSWVPFKNHSATVLRLGSRS